MTLREHAVSSRASAEPATTSSGGVGEAVLEVFEVWLEGCPGGGGGNGGKLVWMCEASKLIGSYGIVSRLDL